jgi:hypothetical protein
MVDLAVRWPPAESPSILWSTLGGLHILSLDMIVHECSEFFRTWAEQPLLAQNCRRYPQNPPNSPQFVASCSDPSRPIAQPIYFRANGALIW